MLLKAVLARDKVFKWILVFLGLQSIALATLPGAAKTITIPDEITFEEKGAVREEIVRNLSEQEIFDTGSFLFQFRIIIRK